MPRTITSATTLENLRKEAKRWLKALRAGDADARNRFDAAHPKTPAEPTLRDVQHALALEYEATDWAALKRVLSESARQSGGASLRTAAEYEALAEDWVRASDEQDAAAIGRLNAYYHRAFTADDVAAEIWRRVYGYRQRSSRVPKNYLALDEARILLAQDVGFSSWPALLEAVATGESPIPPYELDEAERRIAPRRHLGDGDWDRLIAVMRERRVTSLDAGGLMTDEILSRVARLPDVIELRLGGSRELTDDGLQALAGMPQLELLDLSEYPGGKLTDRGLQVLRHLPNLRTFELTWQRGISDAGVAHLAACDKLERVNLMGSPTGDGAIAALRGKPRLRHFSTGALVTDAGLPLLQEFPRLKEWTPRDGGKESDDGGAELLIDGPFTDDGLAGLAGLDGVAGLDLFWHVPRVTAAGFAHLHRLANLMMLGADGRLSDDQAMEHMAAMPRLRKLRAQATVATDDGFEALSRSRTLESLWTGRDTINLTDRGFAALSRLASLRGLGVSCKNVTDEGLSRLPDFPGLRELTPIDVTDAGFAHVGGCASLERLTCMYCRDTTDAATRHIAGLQIRYYYAGLTLITDASLEILGRIQALEQIELYECNGVTDAGLVHLAAMPRLREVHLDSLPGVTLAGTRVLPASVRVKYTT